MQAGSSLAVSLPPETGHEVSHDAIELTFWQSVQASDDPVEYQAYLDRYPTGIFAPLAQERLRSTRMSGHTPPRKPLMPN